MGSWNEIQVWLVGWLIGRSVSPTLQANSMSKVLRMQNVSCCKKKLLEILEILLICKFGFFLFTFVCSAITPIVLHLIRKGDRYIVNSQVGELDTALVLL